MLSNGGRQPWIIQKENSSPLGNWKFTVIHIILAKVQHEIPIPTYSVVQKALQIVKWEKKRYKGRL